MKKQLFIFLVLAFGGFGLTRAQQTPFATSAEFPTATLARPVNNNSLLSAHTRTHVAPVASPASDWKTPAMQGCVYSNDLFNRKNRRSANSAMVHQGFAEISAYQQISPSDIGATGASSRKAIGPPPPTPHPDDPHVLPIGDAWWVLLLLAGLYAVIAKRRKQQE